MLLCILFFNVVFEVVDRAVMLRECRRDRWPLWCVMANEVESGFFNAGCFAP